MEGEAGSRKGMIARERVQSQKRKGGEGQGEEEQQAGVSKGGGETALTGEPGTGAPRSAFASRFNLRSSLLNEILQVP